jgi:hypothetical protein
MSYKSICRASLQVIHCPAVWDRHIQGRIWLTVFCYVKHTRIYTGGRRVALVACAESLVIVLASFMEGNSLLQHGNQ